MDKLKESFLSPRNASIGFVFIFLVASCYLASRWREFLPYSTGLVNAQAKTDSSERPSTSLPLLERNASGVEFLRVPESIVRSMKLSSEQALSTSDTFQLRMTGQLMLDPSRLVHVNTRFAGEVMSLENSIASDAVMAHPLRVGDRVQKGQLLAVLWSKEIGEKKSDLVDAISQLMQHEATLKNMKSIEKSGGLPQRTIDEMRRNVEADVILVERLRRTLLSWRIDETEMQEIESEASRVHFQSLAEPGLSREQLKADPKLEKSWAEVDIRSPMDGEILEINLAVGDIMSPSDDLFKIADLSRLVVMANAYEEDLTTLKRIPLNERSWVVKLISQPDAPETLGEITTIGSVIDPSQHTAIVQGWIDNSRGNLQVGQFIEALVTTPLETGLVEFPSNAVIDAGSKKFVFLAIEENLSLVQRREVHLKRRTTSRAYVSSDGELGVKPGDRVLTRGLLELLEVWNQQSVSSSQQ